MKKALLSLAVAGLALSAAHSSFAVVAGGQNYLIRPHGPYNILQAYPATLANTAAYNSAGVNVRPNVRFSGDAQVAGSFDQVAVPGIFALAAITSSDLQRLNTLAFATCPTNYGSPFVQNSRLTKTPARSEKCPGTFPGGVTFYQFGGNVRTWWSLIYTPPGTVFTLDVTVRCIGNPGTPVVGQSEIHIDRWTWVVNVSFDSLRDVLIVLHSHALGTSEIPCIASEDMYIALRNSLTDIQNRYNIWQTAVANLDPLAGQRQLEAQDAVFRMEALVIAFSAFGDCFVAENFFNTLPPGNDMQNGAFGWTGILDTIENPCACKILADIEKLAGRQTITAVGLSGAANQAVIGYGIVSA